MECEGEFNSHLFPRDNAILHAQEIFKKEAEAFEVKLKQSDTVDAKIVSPAKVFNVSRYYSYYISSRLPAWSFTVFIFLSVIASEAAAERYFSSESYFHESEQCSGKRTHSCQDEPQQLHKFTNNNVAKMRIRWNDAHARAQQSLKQTCLVEDV
eukprot:Pompholyxophrys_punicea_v1_NODE_472_length_1879_cov_3.734101.p1 type:complete len:154 gc:universal NODE_472_length_1879_cov_3.734101:1079-1540(+)